MKRREIILGCERVTAAATEITDLGDNAGVFRCLRCRRAGWWLPWRGNCGGSMIDNSPLTLSAQITKARYASSVLTPPGLFPYDIRR